MTIRVFGSAEQLSRTLARAIARQISANPRLVLGLPTGQTPVPLYGELTSLYRRGRLDFANATTFNLDEFEGLSGSDPHSYRAFMQRHLFDAVNLPSRRIHFLNGRAPDARVECARYERAIRRAGGIDLQVLGLGSNGHIGFNEPGSSLISATHRTRLTAATRRANAEWFDGRVSEVPRHGLSMGMATILQARQIVLLATGAGKAACVAGAVRGPITPRLPASFLQLHGAVEMWLDRAAARKLAL